LKICGDFKGHKNGFPNFNSELLPDSSEEIHSSTMTIATRIQSPTFLRPEILPSTKNIKSSLKTKPSGTERRRVLFKETVSVRPITHIDDMSEERIHAVWYDKKDFEDIKKGIVSTVRLMMSCQEGNGDSSSSVIDNEEHCSRGLEYRTRDGASARRENKWNALNAVLDEQDRQKELGIQNEKLLSQIYITENRRSRLNALQLGIQDENAAKAAHFSDHSCQRSNEMMDLSNDSECSDADMDYCNVYQES
jgi:hypothetical protein